MILALLALGAAQAQSIRTLSVAGGAPGSAFAAVASAAAEDLTSGMADREAVHVASAGSVETIERLLVGEVDLGLALGGDAALAYRGLAEFDVDEEPRQGVRAIGFVHHARSQVVTLADSEVERIDDLAGGRLAVGAAGSGDAFVSLRLLRQTGLLDSVTPVYAGGREAIRLLRAGRVDAVHGLVGEGDDTFEELLMAGEARLVDTADAAIESGFFERFPFYAPSVTPSPPHGAEPAGWGDDVIWVAREGLSDDDVYAITAILYGGEDLAVRNTATVTEPIGTSDPLRGVHLPLHGGAARYWLERGVVLPDEALPVPRRVHD